MDPWYVLIAKQTNTAVFLFAMLLSLQWRKDMPHWQFVFVFGFLGMIGSCFHWIFDSLFFPEIRVPLVIVANGSVGLFFWKIAIYLTQPHN